MSMEAITGTTINRLKRKASRGEMDEVRDLIQPGLTIRATGRKLTWYFRFTAPELQDGAPKGRTAHPICPVATCTDPVLMRQVVGAGRVALEDGSDPIAAVRAKLAEVLKLPDTRVVGTPEVQTWTFAKFHQEFGSAPPAWLRGPTAESYHRAMSRKQVGKLYDKFLVEITSDDIEAVRDSIHDRGKVRQSELTTQALKTAFSWAGEPQRARLSGLSSKANPAANVSTKKPKPKRTKEDAIAAARRVSINAAGDIAVDNPNLPSEEDLGKLLVLLLHPYALPLVRRALLLLLLFSVQRRLTVASALHRVILWLQKHKCGVWILDGGTTKAGTPHILPFAETACSVVKSWAAALPVEGDWMFPGMPTKKKPIADGHIDVRTANEWLYEACEMAGCSRQYGTHVFRKAFGTYLSLRGVSAPDRKLILHHAEGRAGDVTEEHYNLDPMFEPKRKVIGVWNKFLEECVRLVDQNMRVETTDERIIVTSNPTAGATNHAERAEAKATAEIRISHTEHVERDAVSAEGSAAPIVTRAPLKVSSTDPARLAKVRASLQTRIAFDQSVETALGRSGRK